MVSETILHYYWDMRDKRKWWIITVVLWLGWWAAAARFAPSESELLIRYAGWSKWAAVVLPENIAGEIPFPIPIALLSFFSRSLPTDAFWFLLPNALVGIAGLGILFLLAPGSAGILAVTSPGVVWILMSNFAAGVTLLLSAIIILVEVKYRDQKKKYIWLGFLHLWLVNTSLGGWFFGLVFAGYKIVRKDLKTAAAILVGVIYTYLTVVGGFINQTSFESILNLHRNWGESVDQRVRNETKITGYPEPLPLAIKRLVYNKPYFLFREILISAGKTLSLEKLTAPGQGEATVARSLWGSKNMAWIYFWQIPLVVWGLVQWKRIESDLRFVIGIFSAWGIISLILGNTNEWLTNSIGLIIASLLIISWSFTQMNWKWKTVMLALLVISTIPSFYHFFRHEEVWRDNRPKVQLEMAQLAKRHNATQVTTILGRSYLYYGWINRIHPELFWRGVQVGTKINGVKFDHFEPPLTSGVFVGLPGEFMGSRSRDMKNDFDPDELPNDWQLLETVKIRDTVSFGNGDWIWVVKI